MRIIGGALRGRKLNLPKNFRARPTTDMAKESLFNILANYTDFEAIKALDLFSGTGGISYELVSRGCKDVTLVENDFYHYKFIVHTLEDMQIAKYAKAIKGDAFKFIEKCNEKYDFVFADPPYNHPLLGAIPEKVMEAGILNHNGVFVMEHPGNFNFNEVPGFYEKRNYGSVQFSFFRQT